MRWTGSADVNPVTFVLCWVTCRHCLALLQWHPRSLSIATVRWTFSKFWGQPLPCRNKGGGKPFCFKEILSLVLCYSSRVIRFKHCIHYCLLDYDSWLKERWWVARLPFLKAEKCGRSSSRRDKNQKKDKHPCRMLIISIARTEESKTMTIDRR